ncbi:hypothetical protein H477_5919 [[Clostridium] sordellii ATCC 9714]|nr:hypothetical protein H477_5919 [[Clostridium] sordellii ATCC 9714] [Paeniclostridium sordellii ATCC 9714]
MFYRLSSIILMIATRVPISSASSVSALITFVNSFIFLTISLPPFYIYIISRIRDIINTFHKLFLIFSKKIYSLGAYS